MDRSRTMPRLALILTAALTLLGAALRSVCMLTQFDTEVGYFAAGALTALSDSLYFIAVAAAVVVACLIPKDTLPKALDIRLRLPAAFLWGLALAAFTAGGFFLCYAGRSSNLVLAPLALALPASVYFFVSGDRGGLYPDRLSLLGFLTVLWCVASVAETYTDQFTAMNSPVKVGLQLGFLGLSFIMISELRFRLGKPLPRVAVALTSIGIFTAICGGLPVLLGTGAHLLDNSLHLLYAIVLLCGGLYGLYTLFQYLWFPAEEEPTDAPAPEAPPAQTPNAE